MISIKLLGISLGFLFSYILNTDNHIKWKDDFDNILKRKQIRVLVVYDKQLFFLDGPYQKGASHDSMELFREFIDKRFKLRLHLFNVVYIPVKHDEIIQKLRDGTGDVAIANLTVTKERQSKVAFTNPVLKNVHEVLVTGPSSSTIDSLKDLSGKDVHVRFSSSYYQHLQVINKSFKEKNMPLINLVDIGDYLEDSDLLEMVNSGLLPYIFIDNHKAVFWQKVFKNIVIHENISINSGGSIAWAVRKNNPKLLKILNEFIKKNKKGTLNGNIISNRYFKNNKWAKNSLNKKSMHRLESTLELFKKFSSHYDFDWLMITAVAFQESGLNQSIRSPAGAIGIMQVMQSTANDPNINIKNIDIVDNNIHAGTKYLHFLRKQYFSEPQIDSLNKMLFVFAAYNAGPRRISDFRKEAKNNDLDPNVWFGNVEHIASKRIGRETVQYVGNIYKYYISYKIIFDYKSEHLKAKDTFIMDIVE